MLSHAFSVSSSILRMLLQLWLILTLNFKVENFLVLWVLCLWKARRKPDIKWNLHFHIFIYFNHLSITGLLQHAKFRGRPSWTSSLFLRCKSISLFVWSGYECCEKIGLLGVCFLNSMLLFVREFSDFIWAVLAPLSQLIKDDLRLWSLPCPRCILITDWQLLSLQH